MATAYLNGNLIDSNETPPFSDPKEWDLYRVIGRSNKRRDYVIYIWAPNTTPAVKGSEYAEKIYRQRFGKKDETVEVHLVRNATKKRALKNL